MSSSGDGGSVRVRTAVHAVGVSIAAGAAFGFLLCLMTRPAGAPAPAPAAPPPADPGAAPPDPPPAGWVNDPDEVAAVAATLPVPVFADTPAARIPAAELPADVFLWKAAVKLTGRNPPIKDQKSVGSCVSFGTNTAVERTLRNEILLRGGSADEWSRFAEEATYGGSRVEVGGNRVRGDGSVGAWAARFVTQWGMVPRKAYPTADLGEYSEALCRRWGDRGVPDEFEAEARKYPVESTTQVKTWGDAKKALAQGYAIAVCSGQGFARQRDANGVARASGSWAHCMALDGYHVAPSGQEYGHVTNSWGADYHTGPVGWGDPNPDGFWADAAVVDRMLRQGDSWAFSGVTGFPRRTIDWDWFLAAPARRPRDPLAGRVHLALERRLAW